jgi:hypothetical protein
MNFLCRSSSRVLIAAVLLAPQMANACTACLGDPNTNIAKGANAAIFLMLGLLGGMFALLGAFAYALYRRAKAPMPPHAEIGDGIDPQAEGSLG